MGKDARRIRERADAIGCDLHVHRIEVKEDDRARWADAFSDGGGVAAEAGGAVDGGVARLGGEEVDGLAEQDGDVG